MSFLWDIAQLIFSLWVFAIGSYVWFRFQQGKSLQPSSELTKKTDSEIVEEWTAYRTQKASEIAKRRDDSEVHARRMQREDEALEKWKENYESSTRSDKKKKKT